VSPLLFFLDGGLTWRFEFEESDFAALNARLDEFIRANAERLREEFLALKNRT